MNSWYRRYRGFDGLVHHSYVRDGGQEWDGANRRWADVFTRETRCGITPADGWTAQDCDIVNDPGPVTCFVCLTNTEPTFDEIK